jgi:hypothetical protein
MSVLPSRSTIFDRNHLEAGNVGYFEYNYNLIIISSLWVRIISISI